MSIMEGSSISRVLFGLKSKTSPLRRFAPDWKYGLLSCQRDNAGRRSEPSRFTSPSWRPMGASRSHSGGFATCSNVTPTSRSRIAQRSAGTFLLPKRCYSLEVRRNDQFGDLTEDQYAKSSHRFKKLSGKDIHKIFGPGMDSRQGNNLLNTVQKQRVTGTLDADISGPSVTKVTTAKALTWLRKNYHLDEDAAIMARLEREDVHIRDWQPQQDANPENPAGESVLDQLRAKNLAKEKELEEAEKAEIERLEKEAELEAQQTGPLTVDRKGQFKELARPRKTAAWVERYREKAKLSNLEEPPEVKAAAALIPSGLFVLAGVALCIGLAIEYEPPPREARMFPDIPPAAATIGAIIGINLFFFLCWRLPPMWRFMNMNMLVVPATPYPFSMLGNIFSHQHTAHLFSNMVLLWFVGTSLHDEVGRGRFLAIYIGCGLLGSYVSLSRFVLTKFWTITGLGASGAVYGVFSAYLALNPTRAITLWILPEDWQKYVCVRAELLWWLAIAYESYCIFRGSLSADHFAHVGGMIAGAACAEALKRRSRSKRRRFVEDHPTFNPVLKKTAAKPSAQSLEQTVNDVIPK